MVKIEIEGPETFSVKMVTKGAILKSSTNASQCFCLTIVVALMPESGFSIDCVNDACDR